jgi:putative oxidoreductase
MFMERYGLIAARILMSIIFLVNGLNVVSQSLALHEMVVHGVPVSLAHRMILGGQVLQVIASIGLIFGIYPRLAALALILFLIPATLMAHAFWQAVGTPLYTVQVINFLQERMYGWWTRFCRRHKRATCSASAFNGLTNMHGMLE